MREITDQDINKGMAKMEGKMGSENKRASVHAAEAGRMAKEVKDGKTDHRLADFRNNIRTYMTHNKGASWELIRAPDSTMSGKSTACYVEDDCSLHLQMYSYNGRGLPPPYSSETAMGLVIATGNTGQHLSTGSKNEKTGTYLSRDGGLTWFEIAQIPLIYEYGDHGALIVAAPILESTR